jgi:carbamoyltransferase
VTPARAAAPGGPTGYPPRHRMDILGISFGIDTSACLVRDGVTVAAVLEERFSRLKHDRGWPARSIAWVLAEAGTTLQDVDAVAFFWNPAVHLDFPHPGRSTTYRHHGDYLHMVPSWLLGAFAAGRDLGSGHTTQQIHVEGRDRPLTIHYVTHHRCHAAVAFFPSPYEEAAVLTVDGFGERISTQLGSWRRDGDGHRFDVHEETRIPHSLGSFYAAITAWLGFRANSGEGKVMGLAPYGDDRHVAAFRRILRLGEHARDPAKVFELDLDWFEHFLDTPARVSTLFTDTFGPALGRDATHDDHHMAVAYACQAVTEEALLGLARRLREQSGLPDVVLAGGVAMNSVGNGRLEREGPFDTVWIQPSAGDGGTAVGAALWVWHVLHGGTQRSRWLNDRLGPQFDDEACRAALRKGGWAWTEPEDVAADTASALAAGELVGWFQGRAELGARALGGRSILADPRKAENKDVLNARVKFREGFRPFAPSVIEEAAADFFELPPNGSVPFMQKVHGVRPERREELGGITHVDGTARLQTVSAAGSPRYHALIAAFGEITGVPVVLNTSFNVRGEPMVLTPDDAIRCWATTGLDRLVLGPCVLTKP